MEKPVAERRIKRLVRNKNFEVEDRMNSHGGCQRMALLIYFTELELMSAWKVTERNEIAGGP